MTKTIEFNTGRRYTSAGQLITATLHDDGVVTFMDHSRMIDGEFPMPEFSTFGDRLVMQMYDNGRYIASKRSRDDGMMRGGCNTHREEV